MRQWLLVLLALTMAHKAIAEQPIWRIDSNRSEAHFKVTLRVPIKAEGRFSSIEGELNVLPNQKRNVRVHLNANELRMGGPAWLQNATVSESFLDTQHYPNIDFQSGDFSESILITGGEIQGLLSIKNIRRAVVFNIKPTTCRRAGLSCPIDVSGTLKRSDFKMNAYRWSLKDEVRFHFQLKFIE
jgi:polyisoprenoid-binding protein YceI